jgi:hypothetical protein
MEDSENTNLRKIEYALGVLETTSLLLNTQSNEILLCNIEHLRKILPIAVNELKVESNQQP